MPYEPSEQENLETIAQKMAEGQRFMGVFGEPEEVGDGENQETEEGESGGGTMKSRGGIMSFKKLSVEHYLPKKEYIDDENERAIR